MFAPSLVLGTGIVVRPEGNIATRITCCACGASFRVETRDAHLLGRLADRFADHLCRPESRHAMGGDGE